MASKGILVSDPSLYNMTPTRWVFEYAGLVSNREHQWRTITKTTKDTIIHFLGLDLVPPTEDAETGTMSKPGVEYLPMIAFLNPQFFHDTITKRLKLEEQNKTEPDAAPSTADSMGYDEMVAKFDDVADLVDDMFDEANVDEKIYDNQLQTAQKARVFSDGSPPEANNASLSPLKKMRVTID